MHLRWRLAVRDLRHNPRRHLVGAAGTALAVAVVVIAVSARSAYDATLSGAERALTGSADVLARPLGAVDGRVPPDAVAVLAALPGVERATPVLTFDAQLFPDPARDDLGGGGPEAVDDGVVRLPVDGVVGLPVRVEAPGPVPPGEVVQGRLPAADDEVAIGSGMAARRGLRPGDRVRLSARVDADAVITGLLPDGARPGSANRAPLVAPPALARRLDGDRPGWESVLITLDDGGSTTDWLRTAGRRAPPGVSLQRAADVVGDMRSVGTAVSAGIDMLAAATVLLGCLLCFHMTRLTAAATRRQTAVLRALGARRSQVLGVEALTAAIAGVFGIAAGCLLGRWAATVAIPVVVQLMGLAPGSAPTPPAAYALAAVAAIVVTAVTLCAGRSWAVSPVAFLTERTEGRARQRLTPVAVSALAAGVAGVILAGGDPVKGTLAAVVLVLGAVATLRAGLGAWGRGGRRRMRTGGAVRALGMRAVARDADLAGTSAGLVMATMAVLLATVIGHQATAGAIDTALARQFGADLQIGGERALAPDAGARLAAVPGVRRVALLSFGQVAWLDEEGNPRAVPVLAVDPEAYFAVSDFDWKEGSRTAVREALRSGQGVALARPVADSLGVHEGATIRLQGTAGPVTRQVAGIFVTFAGSGVVLGEADAASTFGVVGHHSALATVDGPVAPVADAVARALPGSRPRETADYRRQAREQLLSLFGIGYGALLTAALLCTVGLGASMSASVLRRERELRLLRGAGATRGQVVCILGVEATLLVTVGFVGARPLGWMLARVLLDAFRYTMGLDLPAVLPWGVLAVAPLAVLALAGLAVLLPARRAARLALVS